MDKEKFLQWYDGNPQACIAYDCIKNGLLLFGIYSPLTMIGAMATARVEVGRNFPLIAENTDGKYLEGRKDLGNINKGDGFKYRGRGWLQLTGKYNYGFFGRMINEDLLKDPDMALEAGQAGMLLAAFFKSNKIPAMCEKLDWYSVRKTINGINKTTGQPNGIDEFIKIVAQYMEVKIVS